MTPQLDGRKRRAVSRGWPRSGRDFRTTLFVKNYLLCYNITFIKRARAEIMGLLQRRAWSEVCALGETRLSAVLGDYGPVSWAGARLGAVDKESTTGTKRDEPRRSWRLNRPLELSSPSKRHHIRLEVGKDFAIRP